MLSNSANRPPNEKPNVETKSAWDFVALIASQTSGIRQYTVNRPVRNVSVPLLRGLVRVWRRRRAAGARSAVVVMRVLLLIQGTLHAPDLDGVGDGDGERRHHEGERSGVPLLRPGEREVERVEVGRVVGRDPAVGHHRREDLRLVEDLERADD